METRLNVAEAGLVDNYQQQRWKSEAKEGTIHHAVQQENISEIEACIANAMVRGNGEGVTLHLREPMLGLMPLHIASDIGSVKIVEYLLKKRCIDLDAGDFFHVTALHLACIEDHYEIARQLLSAGARCDIPDKQGDLPIHWAATSGHADIVNLLITHSSPINAQNNAGWTPLHRASYNGRSDCVIVLANRGGNVNVVNGDGNNALHLACFMNLLSVIDVLLAQGADTDAKNHRNQLPHDLCLRDSASKEMLDIFREAQTARRLLRRGSSKNKAGSGKFVLSLNSDDTDDDNDEEEETNWNSERRVYTDRFPESQYGSDSPLASPRADSTHFLNMCLKPAQNFCKTQQYKSYITLRKRDCEEEGIERATDMNMACDISDNGNKEEAVAPPLGPSSPKAPSAQSINKETSIRGSGTSHTVHVGSNRLHHLLQKHRQNIDALIPPKGSEGSLPQSHATHSPARRSTAMHIITERLAALSQLPQPMQMARMSEGGVLHCLSSALGDRTAPPDLGNCLRQRGGSLSGVSICVRDRTKYPPVSSEDSIWDVAITASETASRKENLQQSLHQRSKTALKSNLLGELTQRSCPDLRPALLPRMSAPGDSRSLIYSSSSNSISVFNDSARAPSRLGLSSVSTSGYKFSIKERGDQDDSSGAAGTIALPRLGTAVNASSKACSKLSLSENPHNGSPLSPSKSPKPYFPGNLRQHPSFSSPPSRHSFSGSTNSAMNVVAGGGVVGRSIGGQVYRMMSQAQTGSLTSPPQLAGKLAPKYGF